MLAHDFSFARFVSYNFNERPSGYFSSDAARDSAPLTPIHPHPQRLQRRRLQLEEEVADFLGKPKYEGRRDVRAIVLELEGS